MDIYAIVGTGGFGREVIPVAHNMIKATRQDSDYQIVFVTEKSTADRINGYATISENEFLSLKTEQRFFNIAIGDSAIREKVSEQFITAGARPFSITSTNSTILSNNEIGQGCILCPFTTITSNAKIGKFFHANIYSYVAHDCQIGDYVTFAPGVHCNGGVIIEDHAYIGAGAIIKQSTPQRPIIIGRNSIVGMGSVVTKSVPPNTTVFGNPAKPMR